MFYYIYGDVVGLFEPGKWQAMIAGRMAIPRKVPAAPIEERTEWQLWERSS